MYLDKNLKLAFSPLFKPDCSLTLTLGDCGFGFMPLRLRAILPILLQRVNIIKASVSNVHMPGVER